MIYYRKDTYGIVTLTLDMSGRSVNIINHEIAAAFIPVIDHLEKDEFLKGVIITSAKPSFMAGGDLDFLHQAASPQEIFEHTDLLRTIFRRFELLKIPVVAAINGAALGSGFEFTLACHRRIALDTPKTIIGLPEVSLGMIPGGGGIIRLLWMLGLKEAFNFVTSSRMLHVKEAFQKGLIDDIATDKVDLLKKAHQWILSNPDITKPWDKGNDIEDHSDPKHPVTAKKIAAMTASVVRKTYNNYPAVLAVLNTMVEGAVVDFRTATRINARYFTAMILSKDCQNMTKAFWYDLHKIKNGASRPKGFGRFRARKVGVIGAGQMGSGIAYMCAMEGIEVVIKDMSKTIAEQGKKYSERMLDKLVQKGKMTPEQSAEILDRILPTDLVADFEKCDLIIEAVFENADLKMRIIRETEMHLDRSAFIASNTASLLISDLSKACVHPQSFVGLHFFAPVTSIPLVEVIKGSNTSDETVAKAFDFVLQIGKTPIIVKDTPAFFVSRVASSFLLEGFNLLLEGQLPAVIENAALKAGMPLGPLAFADSVLLSYILDAEKQAAQKLGPNYKSDGAFKVLNKMVQDLGRRGKLPSGGFYDYPEAGGKFLWKGLAEHFPISKKQLSQEEMMERMLFVQCLESVRCLEEGVVNNTADANLGSIYGWGFPAFKGGVIQYINDYGVQEFVLRAQELEKKYGRRFEVPALLEEMALQQTNFI